MKRKSLLAIIFLSVCLPTFVHCGRNNATESDGGGDLGLGTPVTLCEHVFGEWETTAQATCREDGESIRTCGLCGVEETKIIEKTGEHTPVQATGGMVICQTCGELLEENKVYTITFQSGNTILKTESLKVGEVITAPTPGANKWYVWNNSVPDTMPSKDVTFSVKAIGGDAWADTTWEYDYKGKLCIHGKGNMSKFSEESQPWAEYKSEITSIEFDSTITSVGKYAFFGCTALSRVVIPDSITTIGDYAFANCDGIRELTIGAKVSSIGTGAFASSYNLEWVEMRGSLSWIVKQDNYSTEITFNANGKYENASIFREYCEGKFLVT